MSLEASHELNFSLHALNERIHELSDVVAGALKTVADKILELKMSKTSMNQARLFDLSTARSMATPLHATATTPTPTAVDSPKGATGIAEQQKLFEDFRNTLYGIQKSVIHLTSAHESLTTAMQVDFRKRSGSLFQGPVMFPWARFIPHPLLSTPAAGTSQGCAAVVAAAPPMPTSSGLASRRSPVALNTDRAHLPRIPPESAERSARASLAGTLTATVSPRQQQLLQQQQLALQSSQAYSSISRSNRLGGSGAVASSISAVPAQEVLSASLYFCFDALARVLRISEGVVYVQKTVDEAQAVCVYGPKPRHPLSVQITLRSGLVASVLKSGIALNVAVSDPSPGSAHMACFPIFEGPLRMQPIGAVILERYESPPLTESECALVHLFAVQATQFLTGYGVDLVSEPYDPLQGALRQGTAVAEFLRSKSSTSGVAAGGKLSDTLTGFQSLQQAANGTSSNSGGGGGPRAVNVNAVASLISGANYPSKLAASIACQSFPQFVFHASHKNHGYHLRAAEFKGNTELLQYQNIMDVASYIQRLNDSWRRSTDDLQGMEKEQIAQMQDLKQGNRKLRQVTHKLDVAERKATEFKEKYDVLKKELHTLVYD